jgi:formylmethanofuran dehydrogenase subunit E
MLGMDTGGVHLKEGLLALVVLLAMGILAASAAEQPCREQGKNSFVETGVDLPDDTPTWYAPMLKKPYAPVFEILATRGTQGRYYDYTYAVGLKEIIKFHGHDCEGLTHAACCCKIALDTLFPDKIVDRSVLWGISGTSPCWSDVVAFLTGARIQYGNLAFFKDPKYGHAIVLYRVDTGVAVLATWKKGINNIPGEPVVLDQSITWTPRVDQQAVMELKAKVKGQTNATPYQVDQMRYLQWMHINDILMRPLSESYQVKVIENFKWDEWIDEKKVLPVTHKRADIKLKNHPYRQAPISKDDSVTSGEYTTQPNKTDARGGK